MVKIPLVYVIIFAGFKEGGLSYIPSFLFCPEVTELLECSLELEMPPILQLPPRALYLIAHHFIYLIHKGDKRIIYV